MSGRIKQLDTTGQPCGVTGWLRRGSLLLLAWMCLLAACGGDEADSGAGTTQDVASTAQVEAVIAVERAMVFPAPDHSADPLTYLYQRERVPVHGKSADGVFLLTTVDGTDGWILAAQVILSGDPGSVPVIDAAAQRGTPASATPMLAPSVTPTGTPTAKPTSSEPTRTPLPSRTPLPTLTPTVAGDLSDAEASLLVPDAGTTDPDAIPTSPSIRTGEPPPLTIDLPDGWEAVHMLMPFRTFNAARDVPLTIYFGPLPDAAGGTPVTGYIYLFWGFPNVVSPTGEFSLWADGLQILRGSLVGESCNLGIDQEQQTFYVGGIKALGTFYTAVSCEDQVDTAGWFAALRVDNGNYAFYTAVEPLDTLPDQVMNLQAILDTVEFLPPEE
ncbi:MAG: hypothetical protein JXJ20_04425 [Anaerolineae bacterium]|nr:hypothetical protein [Anaerolineae bacterium]